MVNITKILSVVVAVLHLCSALGLDVEISSAIVELLRALIEFRGMI